MINRKAINRKAVELSFNFIIILIISIALFGFGVIFIRDLFSQATELRDLTINDLDVRIGDLICEGSDKVCIGIDTKTIKRKEFDVFGLKILNVLESQNFVVSIKPPSNYLGYDKNGEEINEGVDGPKLTVYPETRTISINQNEAVKLGIGVQVPANAVSGTYILNVDTKVQGSDYTPDNPIYKLNVEVP